MTGGGLYFKDGVMATLTRLVTDIQGILQDDAYIDSIIVDRINDSLQSIAAGIRMPNGEVSPPLPDLLDYDTVATTTAAYASLPADFQRNVFLVLDSSGNKIAPPRGGNYQAFSLFLKNTSDKRLTEAGSVYAVAVKGLRLYYQGIPSVAETLGVHFYRKPLTLALDGDEPEGIPAHLAGDLLKHAVCMKTYIDIEDGQYNKGIGAQQHTTQFFNLMTNLCDFIGIDGEPQYYGDGASEDAGACDG